ncbi:MAG TPA: ATP-binding protein [Planctomycetota bacterium]|nr:ATP-binding protein [Planctomycetota bacterium]
MSVHLSLCDEAGIEASARAVRELLAFLVSNGFACATRARIAGATAELLENVARHAYPDSDGPFRLEATLKGRRLIVEVADDGIGFDTRPFTESPKPNPLPSGLARARALAEDINIESRRDRGSSIALEFTASSVMFADERGLDLSDLDYIDPTMTRRVLSALRDGSLEPQFHFSPALAVCVGRLLSAPQPSADPLPELWS